MNLTDIFDTVLSKLKKLFAFIGSKIAGMFTCALKWNECITIPLAVALWIVSPIMLRWVDPTASIYDAGIFQVILFTIIQFLIYHGVVWIILKITWPGLYNFLDDTLEQKVMTNGSITQWEKCKLVLWIFSLYLLSIVLISRVI